ncbi:MAG: hypothetical protein R3C46_03040 [Hyphomonadaceae bacterium]
MHALTVARLERRGLQPLAFLHRVVDHGQLVIDHARRRHVIGRNLDDEIRRAERPVGPRRNALHQRVFAAFGNVGFRACLDPVDQRLGFRLAEVLVVLERAIVAVGVERRHAVAADRLAHHRREGLHHLVVDHVPRRDAVRLVTVDAALHQDRHDIVRVGDLAEVLAAVLEGQPRALHIGDLGGRHRAAGDELAQRRLDLVGGTMEHDFPRFRIHDHRLAGIGEAERVADQLELVVEQRQRDALRLCFHRDGLARVRFAGVDQVEDHAFMLGGDRLQRLGGGACAIIAIDVGGDHDSRRHRVVFEDVTHAGLVGQQVVIDLVADKRRGRFARTGRQTNDGSAGQESGQLRFQTAHRRWTPAFLFMVPIQAETIAF